MSRSAYFELARTCTAIGSCTQTYMHAYIYTCMHMSCTLYIQLYVKVNSGTHLHFTYVYILYASQLNIVDRLIVHHALTPTSTYLHIHPRCKDISSEIKQTEVSIKHFTTEKSELSELHVWSVYALRISVSTFQSSTPRI